MATDRKLVKEVREYNPGVTVQHYNADVDAAAEPLCPTSKPVGGAVEVQAALGNASVVYVSADGTEASAINGFALAAGERCTVWVNDLNEISVFGGAANQAVFAMGPGLG